MAQAKSRLHSLVAALDAAGISSFKALARSSGVSERQLTAAARRGRADAGRSPQAKSGSQEPLTELVATFSSVKLGEENADAGIKKLTPI